MPRKTRPNPAPLSDIEYAELAAFRYTLRRFIRFSEAAAGRLGLSGQQYQALLVLRAAPDPARVTIKGLARQLLIQHNSAVGLVDRLVAQGLLVRKPASDDARKVSPRLTAKGSRVLERLAGSHREELERIGPELSRVLQQIASATPENISAD